MWAFIAGGNRRLKGLWDWGAGLVPELGFGITEWSTGRRLFVAPELRICVFS